MFAYDDSLATLSQIFLAPRRSAALRFYTKQPAVKSASDLPKLLVQYTSTTTTATTTQENDVMCHEKSKQHRNYGGLHLGVPSLQSNTSSQRVLLPPKSIVRCHFGFNGLRSFKINRLAFFDFCVTCNKRNYLQQQKLLTSSEKKT